MTPLVTVILLTHLKQNEPYLELAVKALLWQRVDFAVEIILISSAETPPELNLNPAIQVIHNRDLNTGTKKVDYAIDHVMHPHSRFVLIHSDDVMLAGHSLQAMATASKGIYGIHNPFCNGDTPGKYIAPFYLMRSDQHVMMIPPNTSIEEMGDLVNSLEHAEPKDRMVIPFDWVAFYCTMIPRDLFDKIGRLDDRLDHKGNDVDFCLRARKVGVQSFVNFGATALHFGSKTLCHTKTPEMEAEADLLFKQKWNP